MLVAYANLAIVQIPSQPLPYSCSLMQLAEKHQIPIL